MEIEQQRKLLAKWELVNKNNCKSPIDMKRFKQTGLLYKGYLFVYGGIDTSLQEYNPKAIFRYDFIQNEWIKFVAIASGATQILFHYGHSAVIYDKTMFVFGGINIFGNLSNQFYALNMDSLHWKKVEVKGDFSTPSVRHSADMIVNKNYIFLYGGRNQKEILSDFWFYKIDTKVWCVADIDNYQHFLRSRYRPGICANQDYIYVYGGQSRISSLQANSIANQEVLQNQEVQVLDDFYRIQVNFRLTTVKPEIKHLKIVTPQSPGKRSGHALVNLSNKQYLILIGGYNCLKSKGYYNQSEKANSVNVDNVNNQFWVYDTLNLYWVCVQAEGHPFKSRISFNCFQYENQILTFGGVTSSNEISQEICRLTISYKPIENYIMKQPLKEICHTCIDSKNRLPMNSQIPTSLLENALSKLQFPFSAFGLLIDCAIMQNPPDLKLIVSNTPRQKYILMKYHPDKSKLLFDNSKDFINAMTMWQGVTYDFDEKQQRGQSNQREQKRYKNEKQQKRYKRMLKSNQYEELIRKRKIFGWNLKVAGLRLGKSVCIMQKDQRQIRVAYLKKGKSTNNQDAYLVYYYNLQQSKYLQAESSSVRTLIDDNNKLAVKQFKEMAKNATGTVILIQDWAQIQSEDLNKQRVDELTQDYVRNDIIYGNRDKIEKLNEKGMLVYQSIDVSLKSYLSNLFIKGQFPILFGVRQSKLEKIHFQSSISIIDKNVRNKNILDVGETVDVESNIIDLYFDANLSRKPNMWNNGVLIYHQDRLIGRYKFPLGSMLQQMQKIEIEIQKQKHRQIQKQKYRQMQCQEISQSQNNQGNLNQEIPKAQLLQSVVKLKLEKSSKSISRPRNFCKLFGVIELPDSYPVNNLKNGFIMDHYLELLFARIKLVNKIMKKKAAQGILPLSDAAKRKNHKKFFQQQFQGSPVKRIKPN